MFRLDTTKEYFRFRPNVSELDSFFNEEEVLATDDLFDDFEEKEE